ncbi:hypothetical protein [Flexistipes sp.]|uniref:hypothetical protein n=1 Tax=Flexistipes sp. TaxID=3088135 RepID=UPI002E1AAC0A|nr:hypothetical protein [Flexistipes sp.]
MSFTKRLAFIGLCAAIYLGIVVFGVVGNKAYAGCAGDCMSCHAELKNSEEHKSLKTCIDCHDPAEKKPDLSADSLLNMPRGDEGCGENCFECHDQWPKDGYHAPLETCQNCHNKSQK